MAKHGVAGYMTSVSIPLTHNPLIIDGQTIGLQHLNAFGSTIPNRGIDDGDLRIVVRFSTHVYTDRATHGRRRDLQDQSGTWRTFCPDRYAVSHLLPMIMRDFITQNRNAGVSDDFNKGSNLILVEALNSESWAIFFCFEPSPPGVLLSVLSAYPKTGNMFSQKKFNQASYYARKCLFTNERVP